MTWAVFGLLVRYLENNLMAKRVLPIADYSFYDPSKSEFGNSKMLIDAQGVRHLQLLEVERGFDVAVEGSLFHLIDNTKTAFGKRHLRKWICSPLTNIKDIEMRQQAIEDLMRFPETVQSFHNLIEALPDLERFLAAIYD